MAAGRGLSRRAGVISAVAGGAWVANISRTHALYAEGDGYRVRLPRMEDSGEPSKGWFLREGTALVGSRAMLDQGQPLRLVVASAAAALSPAPRSGRQRAGTRPCCRSTWTRIRSCSWSRSCGAALAPRSGRGHTAAANAGDRQGCAEVTDARHELDCFDADPAFRDRLSARVGEHLKVLRRKITERGLVRPGVRLSDEVAVGVSSSTASSPPRTWSGSATRPGAHDRRTCGGRGRCCTRRRLQAARIDLEPHGGRRPPARTVYTAGGSGPCMNSCAWSIV